MSVKEKAKKQILNICELIISACIAMIAAVIDCIDCTNTARFKFCSAVFYGYVIVNTLVVINIFIEEQEFHQTWRYIVQGTGLVLYLIAGILVLQFVDKRGGYSQMDKEDNSERISGGILSLVLAVIYAIDIYCIYKKKN